MDRLRRRRGVARTAITKGIAALETLLQDPGTTATDLQAPLNSVNVRYEEMKALDNEIQEGLSDEEFEADLAVSYEYDAKVIEIRTRVEFAARAASSSSGVAGDPGTGDRSDEAANANQRQPAVPPVAPSTRFAALPKLQIPTFSGDRRSWQGFWDHFDATIHSNPALPRIEKFKYLISYLTGKAKTAIEGIRLAEANYDTAISTLTARFGRTDMLVEDHIDSLLALTPVRSSTDVEKLRDLHDQISFRVNALEGLGVSATEYAVVLHRVLMKALPSDLGILYRQRVKEAPAAVASVETANSSERARRVKEILDFLRVQVEIREESYVDHPSVPQRRPYERREPPSSDSCPPSAAALTAGVSLPPSREGSRSQTLQRCPLCDADHGIAECTAPLATAEKRERLQAARLCFRCGKPNHFACVCRTARWLVCGLCSRRHLASLCDVARLHEAPVEQGQASSLDGGFDSRASRAAPSITSASASATQLTPVYLQTARAWAKGPTGQLLLRVLLDTGSQRSFIRRDVARALACPIKGAEQLSLITFGRTRPTRTIQCNIVSVTLKSQHDDQVVTIDALEVPEICVVISPPIDDKVLRIGVPRPRRG